MLAKCIAEVERIQHKWIGLLEYKDAAKRIANWLRALGEVDTPQPDANVLINSGHRP